MKKLIIFFVIIIVIFYGLGKIFELTADSPSIVVAKLLLFQTKLGVMEAMTGVPRATPQEVTPELLKLKLPKNPRDLFIDGFTYDRNFIPLLIAARIKSFEIVKEEIKGNKATVEVKITEQPLYFFSDPQRIPQEYRTATLTFNLSDEGLFRKCWLIEKIYSNAGL